MSRHPNPWRESVLAAFYDARLMWELGCEAASKGYDTEAREYAERYPRPRFGDFLRAYAHSRNNIPTFSREGVERG